MSVSNSTQSWREADPKGRLLRPAEVVERIGISRSQIYAMISEGTFPPFIKLGRRASGMPEAWLDSFIEDRAASALGASTKN